MKHSLIKFNHGVELGARLAYEGHLARTDDGYIAEIIEDEKKHRAILETILSQLGEEPSPLINLGFLMIGNTIKFLCKLSPIFMLDYVARIMELFAIFNYNKLAVVYPELRETFNEMAECEEVHARYFKTGIYK